MRYLHKTVASLPVQFNTGNYYTYTHCRLQIQLTITESRYPQAHPGTAIDHHYH